MLHTSVPYKTGVIYDPRSWCIRLFQAAALACSAPYGSVDGLHPKPHNPVSLRSMSDRPRPRQPDLPLIQCGASEEPKKKLKKKNQSTEY